MAFAVGSNVALRVETWHDGPTLACMMSACPLPACPLPDCDRRTTSQLRCLTTLQILLYESIALVIVAGLWATVSLLLRHWKPIEAHASKQVGQTGGRHGRV